MSEHLSTQTIERYSQRTISAAELLAAGDHLAVCEACRVHAAEVVGAEQIFSTLHANMRAEADRLRTDHVSYEQIASLVDGELDATDRELVETHLALCALCSDEADDLRALSNTTATAPVKEIARPSGVTLRERLSAFWRASTYPTPRFAAMSAALLLLLVAGALIVVWKTGRPSDTEVTQSNIADEVKNGPSARSEISPVVPGTDQNTANDTATSPGQEGILADDSQVDIALNDAGGRVTLDKQGNITGLDVLSPSLKSAVSKALMTQRVETSPALAQLSGRTGTLLGEQDRSPDSLLLRPVGVVIVEQRPRFSWRSLSGASSYTVNVLDSDFNIVATSPPITATHWTPPSSLPRGRVFSWQVEAIKDGQKVLFPTAPAPEARFKVLEMEKAREVMRAEKVRPRSHLALGVLYARAGLLNNAERELRSLVQTNPQSETARKLLRSVQAIKGESTKRK